VSQDSDADTGKSQFDRPAEDLSDDELLERIAELDVALSSRCRRALDQEASS